MSLENCTQVVINFLFSPEGESALQSLYVQNLDPKSNLSLLTKLRRTYTADQSSAILSLARLRQRAHTKFPHAETLFFTQESLEQATAWPLALHRAQRIHELAPPGPLLDLGCGIGGDTLALAQFRPVIAYERNPVRRRFAQSNVTQMGLSSQVTFVEDDWVAQMQAGKLPHCAAAYVDPARRIDGRRVFSLHQMQPPLSALLTLQTQVPLVVVKTMPGVDDSELLLDCGVEFVSYGNSCREAVLWMPGIGTPLRWASVLDDDGTWHEIVATPETPPLGVLEEGCILYEPDPAVIRSGAFPALCQQLDAHLFDPQIAYLISNTYTETPFAQGFQIEEIHPYKLKLLNRRLQALSIGQVELKKRGFPLAPEELRPRLRLSQPDKHKGNTRTATIFFTRQGDKRLMLIGHRL
ncbi:MAG: class I SAM-dependent methyltransferase [Chloroflexota bacterium]